MKLDTMLTAYVDIVSNVLNRLQIRYSLTRGISVEFRPNELSVDDRLVKLDVARSSLNQALSAIDELKKQADHNKKEADLALQDVLALEEDKEELEADRRFIASDVERFKKLAGVRSSSGRRRDKIAGFISGVIASIIATSLISLGVWVYRQYIPQMASPDRLAIVEEVQPMKGGREGGP